MAEIEIKVVENETGTSVKFEVSHLESHCYGAKVYYREFESSDWTATETVTPVSVGTTITVSGLKHQTVYEFYPVKVTEDGDEGSVGNFLRLRVTSGDRITRLRQCIEDELLYYLPPQNISGGSKSSIASDRAFPTAVVFEEGIERRPLFNTVSLLSCRFRIVFAYDCLEGELRNSRLNSLIDEVAERFSEDLSMFQQIEGYYDTEVVKTDYAVEKEGSLLSTATLTIDCLLRA